MDFFAKRLKFFAKAPLYSVNLLERSEKRRQISEMQRFAAYAFAGAAYSAKSAGRMGMAPFFVHT